MPSLRTIIDGQITAQNVKPKPAPLKVGDQVVLRKPLRSAGRTVTEVMVGTIMSLNANGDAVLSLPRAGGVMLRSTVPLEQLSSVSEFYRKTIVPVNPAFRKMY